VRRPRHRERGATLAEFAVSAAVVLLGMFGILDFGRALFTYDLVAHAAQLGTRYAIVRGSTCNTPSCAATAAQVTSYVRSQVPGVTGASLSVGTVWTASGACQASPYQGPGCLVTVTVTYPFTFLTYPFSSFSMTSKSALVISQ
jgi:Flp pilus assembly protein TadG